MSARQVTAMTSNLEDYLEMVYFLSQEGEVHASQLAKRLGVTRASVTGALRALAKRGYIAYRPYAPVELTALGRSTALACAERHHFLHAFLRDRLGMADDAAEQAACKLEHVLSAEVAGRLVELNRVLSTCAALRLAWSPEAKLACRGGGGSCDSCEHRL